MRYIKFRAWDVEEERMINNLEELYEEPFKLWFTQERYKAMQSTGIKDSKGVDIYEGDIIKYKYYDKEYITTVYWNIEEAKFHFIAIDYYWETDGLYNPWDDTEVIGNLYENKELLNGNY